MYLLTGLPASSEIARQGYLERLNVLGAWQYTRGSPTLPIGIVGMGVTRAIRELASKTIAGWNVPANSSDVFTDSSAGWSSGATTMLAGVGGTAGIYGIAPDSPVVHVKYTTTTPGDRTDWAGSAADCATAIRKTFDLGARVVCVASVWATDDPALSAACDYVWNGGGLVVATVGSGFAVASLTAARYPAYYANVVCVGAKVVTDEAFGAWPYSYFMTQANGASAGYGARIDVVADGIVYQSGTKTDGVYRIPAGTDGVPAPMGPAPAAVQVAGVAHLIWSANPGLTNAQVRDILTTCVDKSDAGWMFDSFFTRAGVGIPDAERAVLKAKSLIAANAGGVFPYLRVHPPHRYMSGDAFALTRYSDVVRHTFSGDTCHTTVHGTAGWELGGYCSAGPVTDVELWMDGQQVYHGPPTSKWTGLLMREEHRELLYDLRVVARTATGETGSRAYSTLLSAPPAGANAGFLALSPGPIASGQSVISGTRRAGKTVAMKTS